MVDCYIAPTYKTQMGSPTCERGSIAVGGRAVGDAGFEPLESLLEGFRATLASGVFLLMAVDCAVFPSVEGTSQHKHKRQAEEERASA